MSTVRYPNLELIEYKFWEKVKTEYGLSGHIIPEFKFDMFLQTWPNTATGFDKEGCFSGQALTEEYTIVVELNMKAWYRSEGTVNYKKVDTVIYGVFFNNDLGYIVENPNDNFYEDLKNRNMKSIRDIAYGSEVYLEEAFDFL